MLKILIFNAMVFFPYMYNNIIFLETPKIFQFTSPTEFKLDKEDIRYIRYFFLKRKYLKFKSLPTSTSRPNVDKYFKILKNTKHKEWKEAYLYLLNLVPELLIKDEIGC